MLSIVLYFIKNNIIVDLPTIFILYFIENIFFSDFYFTRNIIQLT